MLSQTPGFFSTAAVSWPVTGAWLVCRALAIAESRVLSEHTGPTPGQGDGKGRHVPSLKKILALRNIICDHIVN